MRIIVALVIALGLVGSALAATPGQVSTKSGVVQGVDKNGVTSWLGIPFAAPPVGELRWKAPEPPAPWQGVRQADKFGPACMQNHELHAPGADQAVSEDCLYLNVWKGDDAGPAKQPVMMYIYGGGFNIGSSAWPQTNGTSLARRGVIVVSIGYRLGKLGFFADPALLAEAKDQPTGNFGILDAIEGLKWIKANIAAFGGDPANVTIFGESAGGAAVNMLMTTPLAKDLFAKAIVESGGPFPAKPLAEAEDDARKAAQDWGVAGDDMKALRALPAATILGNATMMQGGSGPFVDGQVVPAQTLDLYRQGKFARVPIMLGTNSYEAGLFPMLSKGVKEQHPADWPKITQLYDGYGSHDDALVAGQLITDLMFTLPAREAAEAIAATNDPVYVYSFNYLRPSERGKLPGALHFDEVYQVFGTAPTAPMGGDPVDPAIVDAMQSRWTDFAKTGVPGTDWPKLTSANEAVLVFSETGAKPEPGYLKQRLALARTLPPPSMP